MINLKLKKLFKKLLNNAGYEIHPYSGDITNQEMDIINYSKKYSVLDMSALKTVIDTVKYLEQNDIKGAFVECGVWRGGSIITMIKTLQQLGVNDREIYLYDTFEGMANPSEFDVKESGITGDDVVRIEYQTSDAKITLESVKKNVLATGYNKSKIHFIKGRVEDTIKNNTLKDIAFLRLDTDFYLSTKIELECLYPKLSNNGILIIDDYGAWLGSKKATDEYFISKNIPVFLSRIHPLGGRIHVKQK